MSRNDKAENFRMVQIKRGHSLLQSSHGAFAFSVMSHENWLKTFTSGLGHCLFFPAFVVIALFKVGIDLYDVIRSKNKNLGKVGQLVFDTLTLSTTTVAVTFGFLTVTALASIAPFIFLGTMIANAIFNLSLAVYSGVKWYLTKDANERAIHRQKFIKHIIGGVIASALTVGIAFVSVIHAVVLPMATVNAVVNGIGFLFGVFMCVKEYRAQQISTKPAEPICSQQCESIEARPVIDEEKKLLEKKKKFSPSYTLWNYRFVKHRDEKVLVNKNPRVYMLKQTKNKIDELKLKPESTTIHNKTLALQALEKVLHQKNSTIDDFDALEKLSIFNSWFHHPFQAFLRDRSDTEDIFNGAKQLFLQEKALRH